MVFQVVHHYPDDARGGFAQIETFAGREPTPNQPVQRRFDEDDRRFLVQIVSQILIFHRFGQTAVIFSRQIA